MNKKKPHSKYKNILYFILSISIWIIVWELLALRMNKPIFLPSPRSALINLFRLGRTVSFWETIFATFYKISLGFLYAALVGVSLAILSAFCKPVKFLFSPILRLIKAIPVASFIILALLWMDSNNLSILISFMMVLPVIYINVLHGFELVDPRLLEMAQVFEMSNMRKIRYIYFPTIFSSFIAACRIGLGFCFKSGIAAEIIGLPAKSIGSALYKAKLYLMTDELFAWTIVIIIGSTLFEGIFIKLLDLFSKLILTSHKYSIQSSLATSEVHSSYKDSIIASDSENKKSDLLLSIKNLSKSFEKQNVINDFSRDFTNQYVAGIMGDSGIGKTTLLKLIMDLYHTDAGSIEFYSDHIKQESYTVSTVFQEDRLIDHLDAFANIQCVTDHEYSLSYIHEQFAAVGLTELNNKPVNELSGGMRRRVAIVRAILKPSNILILDEPLTGLDEKLKQQVINYIKKNTANRIVIVVSHDASELAALNAKVLNLKN